MNVRYVLTREKVSQSKQSLGPQRDRFWLAVIAYWICMDWKNAQTMLESQYKTVKALGEPFRESSQQPYDFSQQTVTDRVRAEIPTIVRLRLKPPPIETYSLNRKLSGMFLLCNRLGSHIDCHAILDNLLRHQSPARPPSPPGSSSSKAWPSSLSLNFYSVQSAIPFVPSILCEWASIFLTTRERKHRRRGEMNYIHLSVTIWGLLIRVWNLEYWVSRTYNDLVSLLTSTSRLHVICNI